MELHLFACLQQQVLSRAGVTEVHSQMSSFCLWGLLDQGCRPAGGTLISVAKFFNTVELCRA